MHATAKKKKRLHISFPQSGAEIGSLKAPRSYLILLTLELRKPEIFSSGCGCVCVHIAALQSYSACPIAL